MKKITKLLTCFMTVIMVFVMSSEVSIVGAEEATPPSCRYFPKGKDDDSLAMVIELNEITLRGAVKMVNVNIEDNIYIQDGKGICQESAKIVISGYYTYDSTSREILDVSLNASVVEVPGGWTVEIYNQWYTNTGTSLTYTINYSSSVFNFFVCPQGTGNWRNGKVYTIK